MGRHSNPLLQSPGRRTDPVPVFDIRIREPAGAMGSRGTSGARRQSEAITSPPAVRTTRTAIAMSAGGQAVRKSHRPLLGERHPRQ